VVERKIKIGNIMGLHLRAANELVKTASRFESEIEVRKDDVVVDGKSIMALLGLAASKGTELVIRASGFDEEAALRAVIGLVEAKFNEAE
jgi:phosphocarrier protein